MGQKIFWARPFQQQQQQQQQQKFKNKTYSAVGDRMNTVRVNSVHRSRAKFLSASFCRVIQIWWRCCHYTHVFWRRLFIDCTACFFKTIWKQMSVWSHTYTYIYAQQCFLCCYDSIQNRDESYTKRNRQTCFFAFDNSIRWWQHRVACSVIGENTT